MNVFRKCLKRQFGKTKYMSYVEMCEKEVLMSTSVKGKIEGKEIFKDMYDQLRVESTKDIEEREKFLAETLYLAFQIGRKFSAVFIFYVLANIVVLALQLNYAVTCISIALMGACFIYKLVEFLSNKYCFVDAYLIMIYKAVLDKLSGKQTDKVSKA